MKFLCCHTRLVLVALSFFGWTAVARAHDARPAYLEISETGKERYAVLWRTPTLSGNRLPVALQIRQVAATSFHHRNGT